MFPVNVNHSLKSKSTVLGEVGEDHECNIDRVSFQNVDKIQTYLNNNIPVLVVGLSSEWKLSEWVKQATDVNIDTLYSSSYGSRSTKMKSSNDVLTQALIMYLRQQYLWVQQVQKNHYSWLAEEPAGSPEELMSMLRKHLQDSYTKPWNLYGSQDFLRECHRKNIMEMPPHEWILFAATGTGSAWHVDPLNTSAWNTLLVGQKRWGLHPPSLTPPLTHSIKNDPDDMGGPWGILQPWVKNTLHPGKWFQNWFDSLRANNSKSKSSKIYTCEQKKGETMFVPSGWWHTVLNLKSSIAITENVATIRGDTVKRVMEELNIRKTSCTNCGACLSILEALNLP
jgi:hypothetical protein